MLEQRYSDDVPIKRDIPSFIEPRPPLIHNPFMRPRPQKGTNLLDKFEEDTELEEPELVQVYLRLKPCNEVNDLYEVRSDRLLVTSMDTTTAGHGRRTQQNFSKMYTFSHIFGPESTQKEIFESVVKDNLKKLPEGQSFTLLTYGPSGSGKTYTLMGTVGAPGLVPRALEYVFKLIDAAQLPAYKPAESGGEKLSYAEQDFELQWVKRLRKISAPLRDKYRRMSSHLNSYMSVSSIDLSNRTRHYVWVSFVEIYNEAIYDLLSPPEKRTKLRIREDTSGNVYVKGATQAFVRSGEEAYDVMAAGKHNLVVAATGVHAQSSRSHCIFTITMLTETDNEIRSSCVRLCDLAGCERARATRNTGTRMQESRAINSSLHVLERCLHTLRRSQKLRQQRHRSRQDPIVPYRESKLTRLLGSGLSGSRGEVVSMVVTMNPASQYAQETKHVLSLAAVVQDLHINSTTLATTFESSTQDSTIEISDELMKLRAENERLHFELVQVNSHNKELMATMEAHREENAEWVREAVEEAKDFTREYYERKIESMKNTLDDIVDEYETKLSKTAASSVGAGTSSHCLQTKVAELMTEITVLEEKLTAEHLARLRAEKEVEYLRSCIDERDEKAYRENGSANQDDVMTLTDSEHESDDETYDPLNESLEPVFKMENLNQTQQKSKIDEIQQNIDDDCIDNESDNSGNTLKNKSLDGSVFDSTYATGDDDNSHERQDCQQKCNKGSLHSVTESNNLLSPTEHNEEYDKEEEPFDVENNISQVRKCSSIKQDEVSVSYVVDDKKLNLQRGTYCVATSTELPEDSFDVKVKENCKTSTDDFSLNEGNIQLDNIEPKISESKTETVVNKVIDSYKINQCRDNSLGQFEQLEIAVKACSGDNSKEKAGGFGDIKILKEKRNYFEDVTNVNSKNVIDKIKLFDKISKPLESRTIKEDSNKVLDIRSIKEKRIYFDNIDVSVQPAKTKNITEAILENISESVPSVSKKDVCSIFDPKINKRLHGQALTKPDNNLLSINKSIIKKNDSLDVFEGFDSPHISKTEDIVTSIEKARKSIEKLVLNQNANRIIKSEVKLETLSSVEEPDNPLKEISVTENKITPTILIENHSDTKENDNTIEEFNNIYKDITTPRVTEFDLLVSNETSTNINDDKVNNFKDTELKPEQPNIEHQDEVVYNLRNKSCRKPAKRNLRLRKPKNQNEDEGTDHEETKLKDIGRLQQEFSDITINVPAVKKEVIVISSPEKGADEENVPPLLGIHSCPSKSVLRSRRKLFTPQVEPLEETVDTGDSNERVRVPRPSYRPTRVRRKL